jgi:hypothetical protein
MIAHLRSRNVVTVLQKHLLPSLEFTHTNTKAESFLIQQRTVFYEGSWLLAVLFVTPGSKPLLLVYPILNDPKSATTYQKQVYRLRGTEDE